MLGAAEGRPHRALASSIQRLAVIRLHEFDHGRDRFRLDRLGFFRFAVSTVRM